MLSRDKDGWKVERSEGPAFTADPDMAEDAVQSWSLLRAQKLVAYGDKAELAKFGLDKPSGTIIVTVADKDKKTTERKLLLGAEAPEPKGARYARLEGEPAVAVLDATSMAELQHTPLDFVNRALLKLDPGKVQRITRKVGDETLELAQKDDHWRIVKPAEH